MQEAGTSKVETGHPMRVYLGQPVVSAREQDRTAKSLPFEGTSLASNLDLSVWVCIVIDPCVFKLIKIKFSSLVEGAKCL